MLDETKGLLDGSDDGTFVPFTDILFNALLGFTVMVFIAFSLINPEQKTGLVNVKAELIITATWPDNNPDDVDMYVEDPGGNVVWYNSKEAGLLHLDRDDRGNYKDTIVVNGQRIQNPVNQETVTLRGIVPGEYVVNVYHYVANGIDPIPVQVKVEKVNPSVQVIWYGTIYLDHRGQEETALRFTMDADGNISDLNDKPKSLASGLRKSTPAL